MNEETRKCADCRQPFSRAKNATGRWPKRCDPCREANGETPAKADYPERAQTETGLPDVLDIIQGYGLDYMTGNAARFILEYREGNELENPQTARTYLERAIASREAAAA